MEFVLLLQKLKKYFSAKYFMFLIGTNTCIIVNIEYFEINLSNFFFQVGQNIMKKSTFTCCVIFYQLLISLQVRGNKDNFNREGNKNKIRHMAEKLRNRIGFHMRK